MADHCTLDDVHLEITMNTVGGDFLCRVRMCLTDSIRDVKYAVQRDVEIPALAQRLLHDATELEEWTMLHTLADSDDLVMTVVLRPDNEIRDQNAWLLRLDDEESLPDEFGSPGNEHIWANWDIMQKAVNKVSPRATGMGAIRYASDSLRDDRDFVLTAVRHNAAAFQAASDDLRGDREIALVAIRKLPDMLRYASKTLRADRGFVLQAISAGSDAYHFASDDLKNEREIQIAAIRKNHYVLGGVPEDWQVRAVQTGGPWGAIVLGLRHFRCRRVSKRPRDLQKQHCAV